MTILTLHRLNSFSSIFVGDKMDYIIQIESYLEHLANPKPEYLLNICSKRLYQAIRDIMLTEGVEISGKKAKLEIEQDGVLVNGEVVRDYSYLIRKNDVVEYDENLYTAVNIATLDTDNPTGTLNSYSEFIKDLFKLKSDNIHSSDLPNEYKLLIVATTIRVLIYLYHQDEDKFIAMPLEQWFDAMAPNINAILPPEIAKSSYQHKKIEHLEYTLNTLTTDIDELIKSINSFSDFNGVRAKLFKLLNSKASKVLLRPFFEKELNEEYVINPLITVVTNLAKIQNSENRHETLLNTNGVFDSYIGKCNEYGTKYSLSIFKVLAEKLNEIARVVAYGDNSSIGLIEILSPRKKYPLEKSQKFDLHLNLQNKGDGFANNVKLSFKSDSFHITKNSTQINQIKPNAKDVITLNVEAIDTVDIALLKYSAFWTNTDGKEDSRSGDVQIMRQDMEIPWEDLKKSNPYSLKWISDSEKLIGRIGLIEKIKDSLLSEEIESFMLYGQKRVGKTSIARTIESHFDKSTDTNIVIYLDVTNEKREDHDATIMGLVNSFHGELLLKIKRNNLVPTEEYEILRQCKFNKEASILGIKHILDCIKFNNIQIRVFLVIDEFDELHYDFFKPGDKSETLFGNLRGINNNYKNMGFLLIGSERFHKITSLHGHHLNNWNTQNIDTFTLDEYFDFTRIITEPTKNLIKYTENAIRYIYELSNGNPYFSNVVCRWAFDQAYLRRDAEISKDDISLIVQARITKESKTSWQHFWNDGILDTPENKDALVDLRKRTLLAYINAVKNAVSSDPVTETSIQNEFPYPEDYTIERHEVTSTINEFKERGIFRSSDSIL